MVQQNTGCESNTETEKLKQTRLSSAVNKALISAITFEVGHWPDAIGRNQYLHR